jgi:drug/metabolite transporter (DMT)-like permease
MKSAQSPFPEAETPHLPPMMVLLVGILAVSTASVFIRFAQQEASSLVVAFSRNALAALMIAPFALRRQGQELRALKRWQVGLVVLSGFFLALHFATWITSLEYTTVISSVAIVQTNPLWVALLTPIFLRERISPILGVGLLVALVGGLAVAFGQACQWGGGLKCPGLAASFQQGSLFGNFLALCGAWFAAGYVIIGKRLRPTLSLLSYIFCVYGAAALFLLIAILFTGQSMIGFSPQIYLWLVALAVFPQLLGHSSFNWALRYLSAAYVSIALLGEPIGSAILALIFLSEVPTVIEIFGGILILCGILIAARAEKIG